MSPRARTLVAVMALVGATALFPRTAEARGPFGFRGFHGGIYWGYGWPYCGFWGPCYGPYASGLNMDMAAAAGIGAIDVNVKPGEAEVWVDGKFVAEARDLHGNPHLLWLREGPHQVVIYKGGFRSFDEKIAVRPGQRMDLKVRMEKGDSRPPVSRRSGRAYETD